MVASSSSPIKRLYPATSALRIAANLRVIPNVPLGAGSSLEAMMTDPSVLSSAAAGRASEDGVQPCAVRALDVSRPADYLVSVPCDGRPRGLGQHPQKVPPAARPLAATGGVAVPGDPRPTD